MIPTKSLPIFTFALAMQFTAVLPAKADLKTDLDSIKKKQGCYAVEFNFKEVLEPRVSVPYHAKAAEWISLENETPTSVDLLHILITPDPHSPFLKHWREVWTYQPANFIAFEGNSFWQKLSSGFPEGTWAVQVLSVDDSPRYGCLGKWKHSDTHSWSCDSSIWSPVPRREVIERNRKDYQVLVRKDTHTLNENGWVLSEENIKLKLDHGVEIPLQEETGETKFTHVDDNNCNGAKSFWAGQKKVWDDIYAVWNQIYSSQDEYKFKTQGSPLFMALMNLADEESVKSDYNSEVTQKRALEVIKKYMK